MHNMRWVKVKAHRTKCCDREMETHREWRSKGKGRERKRVSVACKLFAIGTILSVLLATLTQTTFQCTCASFYLSLLPLICFCSSYQMRLHAKSSFTYNNISNFPNTTQNHSHTLRTFSPFHFVFGVRFQSIVKLIWAH